MADFKNTIIAINAPSEVRDEVGLYLILVEKESLKENPSRDIILSNLKNASRVSDAYIASSLKKPSNVVEGWIDALFLQRINLKSDPNEINPDFQLEFPKKAQENIDKAHAQELEQQTQAPIEQNNQEVVVINPEIVSDDTISQNSNIEVQSSFELVSQDEINELNEYKITDVPKKTQNPLFAPLNNEDVAARDLFIKAKSMPQTNQGDTDALNHLNEALGIIANKSDSNENIRAAIHLERGKIFDSYDYVDYALRDYWEATKASDLNLKAQAFYKVGQIYDEFSDFSPALDNYLSAVAYSGEADNLNAQTHTLSRIASLYTRQFDIQNTKEYSTFAIDTAHETKNDSLIAETYSKTAQNFQYLGENDSAIDGYKNALAVFHRTDESFEQMAFNYEQAAIVMKKLGNYSKAAKLQLKANQYYQKAQLQQAPLEEAS